MRTKKRVKNLIQKAMSQDEQYKLQKAKDKGRCSREMWGYIKHPNDREEYETPIEINTENGPTSDENEIKEEIEKFCTEINSMEGSNANREWSITIRQREQLNIGGGPIT